MRMYFQIHAHIIGATPSTRARAWHHIRGTQHPPHEALFVRLVDDRATEDERAHGARGLDRERGERDRSRVAAASRARVAAGDEVEHENEKDTPYTSQQFGGQRLAAASPPPALGSLRRTPRCGPVARFGGQRGDADVAVCNVAADAHGQPAKGCFRPSDRFSANRCN